MAIDEWIWCCQVKPINRTESSTKGEFFSHSIIVEARARVQTYAYAIIPEIGVNTNIEVSSKHAC